MLATLRTCLAIAIFTCSLLLCAYAQQAPRLEELFTPPYPFGTGPSGATFSDDGRYLAVGWNEHGESCRDLWVLDREVGQWYQLTDLWPDKEARLRREFNHKLEKDRQEWEKQHPPTEDSGDEAEDGAADDENAAAEDDSAGDDDAVVDDEKEEEEEVEQFDADERIEEFEEDLEKQRRTYYGVGSFTFLRASHTLLYPHEGGIWRVKLDGQRIPGQVLRHEQAFHNIQRIEGSDALLLEADADSFLWWPVEGRLRQLTFGGGGDLQNASPATVSSDLAWLATVRRDYRSVRKQKMPDLLRDDPGYTEHYHVRPGDTPERVKLLLYDLTAEPPWEIAVDLPLEPYYQVENIVWDPSGEHRLLLGTISGDAQYYRAYMITPVADAEPGGDEYEVELLWQEHDEAWINWGRTGVRWAYGSRILYQSEKAGLPGIYEIVYTGPDERLWELKDGEVVSELPEDVKEEDTTPIDYKLNPQYIDGFEISAIHPLKKSPQVLVEYYNPDPTTLSIGLFDMEAWDIRPITPLDGWRTVSTVNEDETVLAYGVRDERRMASLASLDLAKALAEPEDDPTQWLDGVVRGRGETEQFTAWADSWDVRFIQVPVQDFPEFENIYDEGELVNSGHIWVKLYLPPGWQPGGEYPLLLWLHGAGYSQTVMRDPGWYDMLHPWLATQRGWIVAELDYRHSEGYGRDWRIDCYKRLGHPEVEDLIAVKRHLMDSYGGDPERTAIWGWSYGGFLTLMALGLAPGEFPVGCAVAPVNRWENYFYWYSTCHLGDPAENEEAYDRSAAETWLENIGDDLLIVHGLRDNNTLFQSVAQYLEKAYEEDKTVELLLFPSDAHGISNEFHHIDVFEGIITYIERSWAAREG